MQFSRIFDILLSRSLRDDDDPGFAYSDKETYRCVNRIQVKVSAMIIEF